MKIKVYEDRYLVHEKIEASQYENLATTLEFEFPEFIEKNGIKISTSQLNKYIVFDIDQEENQDLIVDNKYSIPYELTQKEEITFIIKMTEASDELDMSDKLIWNSRKLSIPFNEAFEGHTNITSEKIDAFNTAVTALTQKTNEVDQTIKIVETKAENGDFDGNDGLTPYIKNGYWYIGEENTNVRAEAVSIKNIELAYITDNTDVYTITFTDGTTFDYNIRNGKDGKDYIITEKDKQDIVSDVKNDLQPFLVEVKDTSDTALSIAKGANQSIVFNSYAEMVANFSVLENKKQTVGQNVLIITLNVPDLWISEVLDIFIPYSYVSDEKFINDLKESGFIQIGHYKLSALETQKAILTEYVSQEEFNEKLGDIESLLGGI